METGAGDLPDAYRCRWNAITDEDEDVAYMAGCCPRRREMCFVPYYGLLFGYAFAVPGFNREQRLKVAMARCCCTTSGPASLSGFPSCRFCGDMGFGSVFRLTVLRLRKSRMAAPASQSATIPATCRP